jgi:hypothetical protein
MDENNQNNNQPKTEGEPLSRVKTYQDAIAEALRSQEMSSAGMLMAEQKKRDNLEQERAEQTIANPKNKILMVVSIVLIISALTLIAFAIIKANQKQPEETGFVMKSKYFITEKMVEVSSSQLARNTFLRIQQAATESLNNNEIAHLVLTKEIKADPNSAFEIRVKAPYNTEDLLSLLTARAPENIRKVLDSEFLLGVHKVVQNEMFLLFRVTNYENAYSGMLAWETALARDMEPLFSTQIAKARITTTEEVFDATTKETSTSTATTSIPQFTQKTIDNTRVWNDRVIRNTDTRALLDENGRVVFFYSIIDKEYVFFGSNESTFGEVMRRVRSAKLIR